MDSPDRQEPLAACGLSFPHAPHLWFDGDHDHAPDSICPGTTASADVDYERPAAYVRSKRGAWHVLVAEHGDRALTDCGLALKDALIDTLPPARPRVRPCESCRWPEGYPKWPVAS